MARVTKTLDVPGSPKDVFQYLADFSHAAEWDPGVLAAEKATEGPIEVGAAFRLTVAFGPRRMELLYRVTEIDPHRRLVFHCERPDFASHDVITVDDAPGGARITYDAELTLHGWRRAADPLLQVAFYWLAGNAMHGLRQVLAPEPDED